MEKSGEEFFKEKSLTEQISKETLIKLHDIFFAKRSHSVDANELLDIFKNILQIEISEEDFHLLFQRMKENLDDFVSWDEFVSYLLFEFSTRGETFKKVDLNEQSLLFEQPPEILNARHRSPICRILFNPEVVPGQSVSFHRGCYVSASLDGAINYWSLDLEFQQSVKIITKSVYPPTITDVNIMPDIQLMSMSSTNRDLRLYDVTARKFHLKLTITNFDHPIVCIASHSSMNAKEDWYIFCGDTKGSIFVMKFNLTFLNYFKHNPKFNDLEYSYNSMTKGAMKDFSIIESRNVHSSWVTQIAYYENLRAFLSSSRCSKCSLLLSDPSLSKIQYKFHINFGFTCFTFCEENQLLATGGPDCIVRTWNPLVPRKANGVFQGHRTSIAAVIFVHSGTKLYTLAIDRCVKVWIVHRQYCIQTYNGLMNQLSGLTPMSIIYNNLTNKIIVASTTIAVIACEEVIGQELSDGYTHLKTVSHILYNHLFQLVVTTGMDSQIIVWNPWSGYALYTLRGTHRQNVHGFRRYFEITAVCFDPTEHFLLTGAQNGSLKIWHFITGSCLKSFCLEDHGKVSGVVWLSDKILCAGANRYITEFGIEDSEVSTKGRKWDVGRHTDEIICCSFGQQQTMATASYCGELILWAAETGLPYRTYRVYDISNRVQISVNKTQSIQYNMDDSLQSRILHGGKKSVDEVCSHQKSALRFTRKVAVRAILFLKARPFTSDTGTLLLSLETGLIQVWSHHPGGGFLIAFSSIHSARDCATTLATDISNDFLVTGHKSGYIKVWLLSNYVIRNPIKVNICKLRLEFPFLWKSRIKGRAKRATQNQDLPLLLTSVKAHLQGITTVEVISSAHLIMSGSLDRTVRLWTYGGQYLSTFGTTRNWSPIVSHVPAFQYFDNYYIPVDIKRVASLTTKNILHQRIGKLMFPEDDLPDTMDNIKEIPETEKYKLYGKRLEMQNVSYQFKKLPFTKLDDPDTLVFDNTLPFTPVYTKLKSYPLSSISALDTINP
ncbi:WD repeat-containing protein on Y chromosome [Prorops nasuta]|uniref:WD repeat-containing protein on Y chromosome n=1 Tax=Prorops nasuta TaxID=863751 RepID=UPI0034CF69EA